MNVIAGRLEAVREQMRAAGYHALVVPRADEYLGEYIPAHNERLRWLSGFTGSAGFALVTLERAAIFVDGRYTVQVRQQVSPELFEYCRLGDDPHADWLSAQLPGGAVVACDARMHSLRWYRDTAAALAATGLELVATTANLVDACWYDRPAPRVSPAVLLAEHPVPIVRREPGTADLADPSIAVVDVGDQHDPELGNFDHHQFPRDHPPVCSLSLVLQHLGMYEDARAFCDWRPKA